MNELDKILHDEANLRIEPLDHDSAWSLGELLRDRAMEKRLPIAIRIDDGEQVLFHCGLTGSSADNDEWIAGKSRVVRRFGHSSYYMQRLLEMKKKTLAEDFFLDEKTYRAAGGAFPLAGPGGYLYGVVAVSGMSSKEDHEFVVESLSQWRRGK